MVFHNGRKTIGVFIQQVNEEYQNLVCKGISRRANELGYNVAIFANFGGYGLEDYSAGERNMANLPYYEELDGIIIAPDTMNHIEELYTSRIKERSRCPVVSVRKERKDYYNVLVDNSIILENIISHFIEVHKFTRINYLSGPKGFAEIDKRLDCYKRVLAEHGIPIEAERIYYGDLWKNEAYKAVDYWINCKLEMPQAIVCANDIMAITVCKALANKGIKVPDQIAVSGCDNNEEAEDYIPAITSVMLPSVELGIVAVDKIHKHLTGESQPITSYLVSTTPIYRTSCGCNSEWYREISERKMMKVAANDSLKNEISRIAQMSTDLTGLTTVDDAINKISHYWFEYENMTRTFLCLKEDWDDNSKISGVSSDQFMIMEKGYIKSTNTSYSKIKFAVKDLMPLELKEDNPVTYIFASIHYLHHYFGYVGFRFKDEISNMLTLQAWLNNVSSVFENVRMHMELKRLVSQLEDMSIRDELTSLYNRRVLDTLGKKSLEQSIKNHSRLMFFIADMDKLKKINDKFGHTQGDCALIAIANAFQKAADDDEICIRLGGDEFMAIGMDYDETKVTRFVNNFVEGLNLFNSQKQADFGVYISYGWNLIYPDKNTTIEECLFTADYRMYQQKYNKVTNNVKANLLT